MLLLILFIMIFLVLISFTTEKFKIISKPKYWTRTKCDYNLSKTIINVLKKNDIKYSNDKYAELVLPCKYDEIDKEIYNISALPGQKVFIIDGADYIASKDLIWESLVKKYGINKAKKLMPNTYIIASYTDIKRLYNEYDSDKLYILKRNVQRQEGLKIINNINDLIYNYPLYTVVQELLQDPYILNTRKINIRFYVLVVCYRDKKDVYIYDDGFMYYTKGPFIKNTTTFDNNITTGYIDRKVYEENPLTISDFKKYLGPQSSKIMFDKVCNLMRLVFDALIDKLGKSKKLYNLVSFELFGADIALNKNLDPMLMEINKGPSTEPKDKRDAIVKFNCVQDVFKTVGLIENKNNHFIKII